MFSKRVQQNEKNFEIEKVDTYPINVLLNLLFVSLTFNGLYNFRSENRDTLKSQTLRALLSTNKLNPRL